MSRRTHLTWVAAICIAMSVAGCGGSKEPAEPTKTEEQLRREAEAAARQEQTVALTEGAGKALAVARGLEAQLASAGVVPAAVAESVAALAAPMAEAERLAGELEQAGADGWEAAKQRLDGALAALEAARAKAAAAMSGWQARQAEAASAPGEGVSRVSPKTGLIEGLDGGKYEQYKVAAVERAQNRLRRTGHYAGAVDGELDLATMEAVGRFQEEHGLQVSGVPSPMTRARLYTNAG